MFKTNYFLTINNYNTINQVYKLLSLKDFRDNKIFFFQAFFRFHLFLLFVQGEYLDWGEGV